MTGAAGAAESPASPGLTDATGAGQGCPRSIHPRRVPADPVLLTIAGGTRLRRVDSAARPANSFQADGRTIPASAGA